MDKYGNCQNDYFDIYISKFYGDKNKRTITARKSELKKYYKNGSHDLSLRQFKLWKLYYVTYYLDAINKYNIDIDLIEYRFNKDKNSLTNYLKDLSNSDLEDQEWIHSIHARKSELTKLILNGKRNKLINNFLEYDKMVYVFNNRKTISSYQVSS